MRILNTNDVQAPKFGMSLHLDTSANHIIDKHIAKLDTQARHDFWNTIEQEIYRQAKNYDTDVFIRKSKYRESLVADVVDNTKVPAEIKTFSQSLFTKYGSRSFLNFLDNASGYAAKIHEKNVSMQYSKYARK